MDFFLGTQERVRNSRGKRAISVRATEVQLYLLNFSNSNFYRYDKLRKLFSKFYRPHYESVSKFKIGLKALLQQGLSEQYFMVTWSINSKKMQVGLIFLISTKKIIIRCKRTGYNTNVMRQSACLVVNPVTVNNIASLFNCTPVGSAPDSMTDTTFS